MSVSVFKTRNSGVLRHIDVQERTHRPLSTPQVTLGAGELTRSGSVATINRTNFGAGFKTGDKVVIAGAGQAEYNGVQTLTVTGTNTVTFPVTGTPVTPATGTITVQDVDYGPAEITTIGDYFTASATYAVGDVVLPNVFNGFQYTCTVAGAAAAAEPTWPTTVGNTVVSGAATFSCSRIRDFKYFQDGTVNRPQASGPAHTITDGTNVTYQAYYANGRLHRSNGAAIIVGAGSFNTNRYFLNGVEKSRDELSAVASLVNGDATLNAIT